MNARTVGFAGCAVRIEADGPDATAVVDFLFRETCAGEAVFPDATFRVASDGSGFRLSKDGIQLWNRIGASALASLLLSEVIHALVDRSRDGVVLHAALVGTTDFLVLIPGQSGAGKTTLAAQLMAGGFEYFTDELVHVPYGSSRFEAFTRPLVVKHQARHLLNAHIDFNHTGEHILACDDAMMLMPARLSASHAVTRLRPALLIFPRIRPGTSFALHRLSRARAGMSLISCMVNARNLPHHGFEEVSRLVRSLPAHTMTCHGPQRIDGMVEEIAAIAREAFKGSEIGKRNNRTQS